MAGAYMYGRSLCMAGAYIWQEAGAYVWQEPIVIACPRDTIPGYCRYSFRVTI